MTLGRSGRQPPLSTHVLDLRDHPVVPVKYHDPFLLSILVYVVVVGGEGRQKKS